MEKLRIGKLTSDVATAEEVAEFREEARAMIAKYGWEDRTVTPYSWAEPVLDIVNYGEDFELCTYDSKICVLQMLNGLVPILNSWEKQELNAVKIINCTTGKVIGVEPDVAEMFVETGCFMYS